MTKNWTTLYSCLLRSCPPYLQDLLKPAQRIRSVFFTYQKHKAMHNRSTQSEEAKISVPSLAFKNAFRTWPFSNSAYLLVIVSSSVNEVTVRNAPTASEANCELSAN